MLLQNLQIYYGTNVELSIQEHNESSDRFSNETRWLHIRLVEMWVRM